MDRLGEDRDRAGDRAGDDLEQDQRRVGGDRERRRRRVLGGCARRLAGAARRQAAASSARAARPRWLIASFSASVSSAIVRPSSAGRRGRRPGRSRSRPSPRGAVGQRARAAALEDALLAVAGSTQRDRADVGAARCPAGASRSSLSRFSSSVASLAGVARRAHARARRRARRPRSRSRRRSPPRRSPRAAARALTSAFSANVSPVLGRQLDLVGQRLDLVAAGQQPPSSRSLCALRVARTSRHRAPRRAADGRCLRRRAARRCPPAASASSSSRCARESGVRSAVAWTSTRPPSPVITTLASTSARRVLGVVEVEQRRAVDDPARDRGDRAGQRRALELAFASTQRVAGERAARRSRR